MKKVPYIQTHCTYKCFSEKKKKVAIIFNGLQNYKTMQKEVLRVIKIQTA
jgi:hypothetical protein